MAQTSLFKGLDVERGALFSPCRTWRYQLWRIWDPALPLLCFICLNPSTADEEQDDPTVRRCIVWARVMGAGGLLMCNAFAFRATLPAVMKQAKDPIGPQNDAWLRDAAGRSSHVVAGWGRHGNFMGRGDEVKRLVPTLYLLRRNADGTPEHPLYLPGILRPIPFTKDFGVDCYEAPEKPAVLQFHRRARRAKRAA